MPDFHGGHDWAICKRDGRWRIYERRPYGWSWHDVEDTLPAAHTAATQYAVMDELFTPGGLTRLKASFCAIAAQRKTPLAAGQHCCSSAAASGPTQQECSCLSAR
jgi:hypothetical protein